MKDTQTIKDRLETGYHVLQTVLLYRARTGSPGLGWGIERAIVDRELDELESELRTNPPVVDGSNRGLPERLPLDPLPLPSLRPYMKNYLRPLMQPRDPDAGDSGWRNA